jgi:hypothetical protein
MNKKQDSLEKVVLSCLLFKLLNQPISPPQKFVQNNFEISSSQPCSLAAAGQKKKKSKSLWGETL